jgi:uncharacterized protein (TIGR03435 family)
MAAANYLSGQEKSAAQAGNASDSAQPVRRDYRFEVASVRPSDPPNGREYGAGPIPPSYTPGHYRELKITIPALAFQAFRLKHGYELENPRWMDSTYFTVNATLPEGATKADLPIMIQHLLEDRFGLVFHHVTRQMAGYELVVAKSGPKLTKSAGPAPPAPVSDGSTDSILKRSGIEMKNGVPQYTKDAGSGQLWVGGAVIWRGRDKTMKNLATDLSNYIYLNAPVMDATGLEGEYDYTFTFTPEPTGQGNGVVLSPGGGVPVSGPAAGGDEPPEHPLLRDALREQLGLKLQPVKNVPVDVVVLDSANKVPTEN